MNDALWEDLRAEGAPGIWVPLPALYPVPAAARIRSEELEDLVAYIHQVSNLRNPDSRTSMSVAGRHVQPWETTVRVSRVLGPHVPESLYYGTPAFFLQGRRGEPTRELDNQVLQVALDGPDGEWSWRLGDYPLEVERGCCWGAAALAVASHLRMRLTSWRILQEIQKTPDPKTEEEQVRTWIENVVERRTHLGFYEWRKKHLWKE